jgi:hypothetical protein
MEGERIDAQALFLEQATKRKRVEIDAKPVIVKGPAKKETPAGIGQPT